MFSCVKEKEERHGSGAYGKRPLEIVRGAGCTVWDEAGNSYLDATSGMGVALLGHAHPAVVAAIREQAQQIITVAEAFYTPTRAELYAALVEVLPGSLGRFFLCNSGAEALDGALKVARLLTNREGLVAAQRAFHGRTLGSLSLTANPKYRNPFASWLAPVRRVIFNDLEAARAAIDETTAAVFVEPLQGEGGVHEARAEYLRGLRELCDATGALLVFDEIQSGLGRTGTWLAAEAAGVVPDIVCLGKGLAGGLPMGLVAWRSELGGIPRGSHGSTFGGNPLACAAALATLTALQQEEILPAVRERGEWLRQQLTTRQEDWPLVRSVRGRGLLIGLELRGRVTPVLRRLQEQGLLALPAGQTVLRLLPPLILSAAEAEQIVVALDEVLRD